MASRKKETKENCPDVKEELTPEEEFIKKLELDPEKFLKELNDTQSIVLKRIRKEQDKTIVRLFSYSYYELLERTSLKPDCECEQCEKYSKLISKLEEDEVKILFSEQEIYNNDDVSLSKTDEEYFNGCVLNAENKKNNGILIRDVVDILEYFLDYIEMEFKTEIMEKVYNNANVGMPISIVSPFNNEKIVGTTVYCDEEILYIMYHDKDKKNNFLSTTTKEEVIFEEKSTIPCNSISNINSNSLTEKEDLSIKQQKENELFYDKDPIKKKYIN